MSMKAELDFQKSLCAFLKHYRMITGKTQAHIADDCGLSQQTISRLLKEPKTSRKWATIYRVLMALQPEAINRDALKLGVHEVRLTKMRKAA